MSQRIVTRAVVGSLALALFAALISASATGGLAAWLLQRAEDRRLEEAAFVLGKELEEADGDRARLAHIVEDEHVETTHMGLAFVVFDAERLRVAGDARLTWLPPGTCAHPTHEFRACARQSGPFVVIAGGAHASPLPLAFAGLLASALVGAAAFFLSRPIAAGIVAPLSQLQQRLAALDAATITSAALGPPSGVTEVDALRQTIELLLRRVDEALASATRFAADAAHELRTPLSAVQAELELMSEDTASTEALTRVRATVSRLNVLVERLLILATPGAEGPTELLSVRDVVEDTVQALPLDDRARVHLELEAELPVRGDPALLSMLITNAISNGLKFGRQITVRVAADRLQFDDDGPGVPAEERRRVFEPLYRGVAAREGRVPGHGLGLALIAHVARQLGGVASFEDGGPGARLVVRFER